MSSSEDESIKQSTKKGKDGKQDFQIKPSKGGPSLDTSKWPLLLKVMPYIFITLYSELRYS